jgi:putative sterol carrier protein
VRTIRFAENWNGKLDKKVFTTIRRSDKEKFEYYLRNLEKEFQVKLKDQDYCKASLFGVWYGKFEEIPESVLLEDTGLTLEKSISLFNKFKCVGSNVLILTFQKEVV